MDHDRPSAGTRKHRYRKETIRALLSDRDLNAIRDWVVAERNPMRTLSSLLFDHEELIRWRAIETLGLAAAHEWQRDPERVRRQIRRLFWLMNDESGGICWNAPEAIGEILYNVPELIDEYGLQLPSFFLEEPFERGSRWAVARLSHREPSIFASAASDLAASLRDIDGNIRGISLLALQAMGDQAARSAVNSLVDDDHPIKTYDFDSGDFTLTTVGELARAYLESH
jgi:methylated-DNA-[protein]-cysteine S-methyltransferase